MSELKVAVDEINKLFHDFKSSNDQRLEKLEKGQSTGDIEAKLDLINAKIAEQEALKSRLEEIEKKAGRPAVFSAANTSEHQQKHNEAFELFVRSGDDSLLTELHTKSGAVTAADNPFALPETLDKELASVLTADSVMRQAARTVKTGTAEYKKLINLHGATSGWVGETSARPATNGPRLAELSAFMGELYANPEVSQQMLDDAFFNVQQWIVDELRTEFAEAEELAFTQGDGASKPKGFLAYAQDTKKDTDRAFGTLQKFVSASSTVITADELINAVYGLATKYRSGAVFMMNSATVGLLRKLKDMTGQYLWSPAVTAGEPSTLLGYRILENASMSDVAAGKCPVAFGNFKRGYTIVDRKGMNTQRDPFTNKPYVGFYTTKRVGGMVTDSNAIKLIVMK